LRIVQGTGTGARTLTNARPVSAKETGDSIFDVAPYDPHPPRPALSPRQAAQAASSGDPLRAIGAVSLTMAVIYLALWGLGTLMSSGGPAELQQFNAGRPVMLCTAGSYRAEKDTLLGRVFGERHFSCSDWKMAP